MRYGDEVLNDELVNGCDGVPIDDDDVSAVGDDGKPLVRDRFL